MKRGTILVGLFILGVGILAGGIAAEQAQDDLRIWKEFVLDVQAGKMEDTARIRPYYPELLEPMKGYLGQLRVGIAWDKLESGPKVFRVGNQVHFVISLPYKGEGQTLSPPFCFSFLDEKGRWYFQHLDDYRLLFETIWLDRAKNAGWNLAISYEGETCLFRFARPNR
jgi:hypothetical protein